MDAVLTLKWKTDCSLGRYSTAGLEVGSLSFRLRLQDLQIKGKPDRGKSMCAKSFIAELQPDTFNIILSMEGIMS